jgi:leucyl-tRNA synthetase
MSTSQKLRAPLPYLKAAKDFEAKWQHRWRETNAFGTDSVRLDQPKQLILDFFPYPSGIGLHVGHPLGYIATDAFARFRRMQGYNVLYSMGFDSFGLPAEQYAVQSNRHPRDTTEENVANMQASGPPHPLSLLRVGPPFARTATGSDGEDRRAQDRKQHDGAS